MDLFHGQLMLQKQFLKHRSPRFLFPTSFGKEQLRENLSSPLFDEVQTINTKIIN